MSYEMCIRDSHGSDYNFVMRAIRCGFTSIMYDLSALSFEENVEKLKEFTKIAHDLDITVEAELGIMTSTEEDSHGGETGWTHAVSYTHLDVYKRQYQHSERLK